MEATEELLCATFKYDIHSDVEYVPKIIIGGDYREIKDYPQREENF